LGGHNVPKTGPVIFCGNHSNQFIDGSLCFVLGYELGRDVRFMVAAKSFKRPLHGMFFRLNGSIPVERASDLAKVGDGTI